MDTKTLLGQVFWILCGSFLCSSSCSKNVGKDCSETTYNFELPFISEPDKDSIRLGDSITFSINESTEFKDVGTGQIVNFNGAANLGGTIGFLKYDSVSKKWKPSADQFTFQLKSGVWETPLDTLLFRAYHCSDISNLYKFELKISPMSPGLYGVIFGNSGNTYRQSEPCTKASFTVNLHQSSHNRYLYGQGNESTPGGDLYFYVSP